MRFGCRPLLRMAVGGGYAFRHGLLRNPNFVTLSGAEGGVERVSSKLLRVDRLHNTDCASFCPKHENVLRASQNPIPHNRHFRYNTLRGGKP